MRAAGVGKGSGSPPSGKALVLLGSAPSPAMGLAGQQAASSGPTTNFKEIGKVSLKHIYEIAKIKKTDDHLKHIGLEQIASSVLGTCRNIGIRVVGR